MADLHRRVWLDSIGGMLHDSGDCCVMLNSQTRPHSRAVANDNIQWACHVCEQKQNGSREESSLNLRFVSFKFS